MSLGGFFFLYLNLIQFIDIGMWTVLKHAEIPDKVYENLIIINI